MTPFEARTTLTEMRMNQINWRIPPSEMRSRVIANDVLLQQVARMVPNPAAIEYMPSVEMASSLRSS
jgi:hypothetical protein